jgi:hypothetical protein
LGLGKASHGGSGGRQRDCCVGEAVRVLSIPGKGLGEFKGVQEERRR